MAIVLNGTTGITAPDIDVTAQSTDIVTTGDVSAVDGTFSGGVYLGGTGSANFLDDYEEGTWSPSIQGGGWSLSSTSGAKYTKVGNLVFYSFHIDVSGSGNSSQLVVGGLPFAVVNNGYAVSPADFAYGGIKGAYARVTNSTTNIDFFYLSESTGTLRYGLLGNQIGAGYIIVSGCYNTSA